MDKADLEKAFKTASEMVRDLPEVLQQAAFAKAVDFLCAEIRPLEDASSAAAGSGAAESSKSGVLRRSVKTATRTASRPGPKAALGELAKTDFLKTSKTVAEMQHQLKSKQGYEYSIDELSISAVRLLRDGMLDRDKTADGKYAYKTRQAA